MTYSGWKCGNCGCYVSVDAAHSCMGEPPVTATDCKLLFAPTLDGLTREIWDLQERVEKLERLSVRPNTQPGEERP